MRDRLRTVLALLDGRGTRGQSLVELTLTLPILLIMLMGLTEIGWYANNYLTLLDVVREAGRFGATLDPLDWADGEELKYHRMDCEELQTNFDKRPFEEQLTWPGPDLTAWGYSVGDERPIGFYDGVACSVIGNMQPLEFNDLTDDIVVSVFQYVVLNRSTPYAEVRVVGRLPAKANECENDDLFDPFDWNHDGSGTGLDEDSARFDSTWDNVRGYVFRGNHRMNFGAPMDCLGSAFSTQDVEDRLNMSTNPDRLGKIEHVPNFGLVLVEVFWRHRQLLALPWFNLGPLDEGQMIHVWAFFPVSAAEPDLEY
ncbi:MAG: hypothetical protein Kow00106_20290 [Anaerolineae bacterium]